MQLIDVSSDPNQQIQIPFQSGTVTLDLWFSSLESSWFMSINYGTDSITNILVEHGINLAYPFKYKFPFGIVCLTNSGLRPLYVDAFETAEASLILLEEEENIYF